MVSHKPWRPESVLLFCGAQLLCFCFGILAAALLHQSGVPGFRREGDFGNIATATLCFQGATWLLIPLFLRSNEIHWRDFFGLRKGNFLPALLWIMVVLAATLAFEGLYEYALQQTRWNPPQEAAVQLLTDAPLWPTGIYLGAFTVVLAPIAEEFIFRGVLYSFVKQLGFPRLAWFGVSLLFALIHGSLGILIPLFVLALALTWLYEKTGNLLAPIAAHSLFNAVNLAVLCRFQ